MPYCRKCGLKVEDGERCKPCRAAYFRARTVTHPRKNRNNPPYASPAKPTPEANRRAYEARKRNPIAREKMKTRVILRGAVKAGKIKRQPCEVCGTSKVEGHHDDYSKPLDVRWLCPTHHRAIHQPAPSGTGHSKSARGAAER